MNDNYKEPYAAKHMRGSNDGRVVDLSFFNTSQNINNPDPDDPNKVIFDKNDPTGSLLPILFSDQIGFMCDFIRDGVPYRGFNHPSYANASNGAGVLERATSDSYFITIKKPDPLVIQELNTRGISIFSGDRPLRTVLHSIRSTGDNYNYSTFVYIYANRRDAIGVFNPNDPNILPANPNINSN